MTLLDMKPLFCYTISATYFRLPFILAQRGVPRLPPDSGRPRDSNLDLPLLLVYNVCSVQVM